MDAELEAVLDRVALDVEAGVSYHQSGGESLRARTASPAAGPDTVRAYRPYNAVVLHAQLVERGLPAGSGEFVTEHQCGKLGGKVLPAAARYEERFLLESGDRRGSAVGMAGAPAVALRPGAYRVLHSETQTTLAPSPDPRVLCGRDREIAAREVVRQMLAGAGARLEPGDRVEYGRDTEGLVLCHPRQSAFTSPGAWASSVVSSVAAAVSDDAALHDAVRVGRFGGDALRQHNARARRARSGVAVEAGSADADGVCAAALTALYARASGGLARREGARVDWEHPVGEPVFDAGGRSFRPRAPRLFKGHGPRRWEAFQQAALAGLCRAVGTPEERRAADAAGALDRAGGLRLVEAVAGALPGLDRRVPLGRDEAAARPALVGALTARSVVEGAGVPYVPAPSSEAVDAHQAAVLRAEGLRSVCADASNIGAWVLDRGRTRERLADPEPAAALPEARDSARPSPAVQQELSW